MKRILLILLGLAIIGGFIGYKMWTKPHENMAAAAADIQVQAAGLYGEFEADETAANGKYLEKVILVSGSVAEVTQDGDRTKVMLLAGDEAMGGVYCEMDPLTEHARTEFAEGETVKLKCNCSGYTGIDVQMARCVEVK